MIDLSLHKPKRIEKIKYRQVYVFDCFQCLNHEIRPEKKHLKTHKGLCRYCTHKGIPYKSSYNHLKDGINRTNKKRSKQKSFDLTFDEFLEFVQIKNCHYCNNKIEWVEHTGKGQHRYNLDRKDSDLGYIKHNLVVCCKRCNYMKGSEFSYEEFKAIVELLHNIRKNGFKYESN